MPVAKLERHFKHPGKCPFCDNDDIKSGQFRQEGAYVVRRCKCNKCNLVFKEIFKYDETFSSKDWEYR